MRLVHPSTIFRPTHPVPLTRICFFLTALGFIRLISSRLELIPDANGGKPEIGENSSFAAQRLHAWGQSQWEAQQQLNSNSVRSELDSGPIHLALVRNDEASYFWRTTLYNSEVHERWTNVDPMGRNVDELDLSGIVQSLEKEYLILKHNLRSCRKKLVEINILKKADNAYEVLNSYLENHATLIFGFFIENNQIKSGVNNSVHKVPQEIKSKILICHFQNQLSEIEGILTDLELKIDHSDYEREGIFLFRVHLFDILNCLVKYRFIEESYFERWVNKKDIVNLLADHIIVYMDSKSLLLGTDLREGIYKSKLSKHLGISLKFLSKESWNYIELESFFEKRNYFVSTQNPMTDPYVMLLGLWIQHIMYEKEHEKAEAEMAKLVKELVSFFENSPYDRGAMGNYHTYGLLYQMIHLVMRYSPGIMTKAFETGKLAKSFSLKIHVFELALKVLKNSREVNFLGYSGYWTTEIDSQNSKHLISLREVESWRFVPDFENRYFFQEFSFNLPGELVEMKQKLREFTVERNSSKGKDAVCVNKKYEYEDLPVWFGGNFSLEMIDEKNNNYKQNQMKSERKVSTLFLEETYSWIQKLEFVLTNFRKSQREFVEIMKSILSEDQGEVPQDVKQWIKNSQIMKSVNFQITLSLKSAESFWKKIMERLDFINKEILISRRHTQISVQNLESCQVKEKLLSKMENKRIQEVKLNRLLTGDENFQSGGLLFIPNLDFSVQTSVTDFGQ